MFNIKITTPTGQSWLAFITPVDFDTAMGFVRRYISAKTYSYSFEVICDK